MHKLTEMLLLLVVLLLICSSAHAHKALCCLFLSPICRWKIRSIIHTKTVLKSIPIPSSEQDALQAAMTIQKHLPTMFRSLLSACLADVLKAQ